MPPGARAKSKREIEDEVVKIVASALRGVDGVEREAVRRTTVHANVVAMDRGAPGLIVGIEPVEIAEDVVDEVSGTFIIIVQRISTAVTTGEGEE